MYEVPVILDRYYPQYSGRMADYVINSNSFEYLAIYLIKYILEIQW